MSLIVRAFIGKNPTPIAELHVVDPVIQDEAYDALAAWGADYSTLNGQNYPGADGEGPKLGFVLGEVYPKPTEPLAAPPE